MTAHNRRQGRRWARNILAAQVQRTEAISDRLLDGGAIPSWARSTASESRIPVTLAVLAALAMQITLSPRVQLKHHWILPTLGVVLLVVNSVGHSRTTTKVSPTLRLLGLAMIASLTTANIWSGTRLVNQLLNGHGQWGSGSARTLLFTGGAIWMTNVIVFGLWYWEFDRGGPVARAQGAPRFPDFLFPQMESPDLAPPEWAAGFVDYLYLSFSTASAFSATDVLPLSRRAKLIMLVQAAISLATVALVVARAVNIL